MLGFVLALMWAGGSVGAADRNIVFVIADDLSPTLGCYGDERAFSPSIDALAEDGIVFDNAYATTASCSASRSVVLSGLHNHRNGQYGHQHHYHKFATFPDVAALSLPLALSRGGYRTARVGKYHVAPEPVYHFDHHFHANSRNPVAMADAAEAFIREPSEQPFFLYYATSDPHRSGSDDETSPLKYKPNLFGNKSDGSSYAGIEEVTFDADKLPVPAFLPDTPETRAELAQYYQSSARIDRGVARLTEILRSAGLYDKTLIVFTSDHGMAFAGGKTTVYEGGLKVPLVVRDPYQTIRGERATALVSHVDLTPTMLDFAGQLDTGKNTPRVPLDLDQYWKGRGGPPIVNRDGGKPFDRYHGRSWMPVLSDSKSKHHSEIFASHTFHEIQMYYPMRVVRDEQYKLIWNIAHPLPYPFASDLWAAGSWQAQWAKGADANYGNKTVGQYVHRAEFELYDLLADPDETTNLAISRKHDDVLRQYQGRMRDAQERFDDPWIVKWDYE